MNFIVIEEIDSKGKSTIIGISENMDISKYMINEYYGTHEILGVEDIRESGIEYVYNIKFDKELYKIVFRDFKLNEI